MIQNEKGSTLIENMISIFLLSILSVMVVSSLSVALKTMQRLSNANDEMYGIYTDIEENVYTTIDSAAANPEIFSNETGVTMTFKIGSEEYIIEGGSIYDSKNLLGEFYRR